MRLAGAALIAVFTSGCYCAARIVPATSSASPTGAPAAGYDIIAVLPHPDSKKIGRAVVTSTAGGSVELSRKGNATRVATGQPPSVAFRLSGDQAEQLFGDAFAARPAPPRHFLLYFESGANQLTRKSERLLPEILVFVKYRPAADVTVAGHTDTSGPAQDNIELARSRASIIRDRLVAAGLDASLVSVVSHGEADPLKPTPDNTPEPKNRRVDVSVR